MVSAVANFVRFVNEIPSVGIIQFQKPRKVFILIPSDKTFKFKKLCPYCKGDLTYTCNGWEEDDYGDWISDGSFDVECSTMPDIESEEWDEWMEQHSDMPYVNQLPVDNAVKRYINKKYRFLIE